MANVKAVIIRRDASGGMTNRVITTPKAVNVVQEGLRASDNMTMKLSAEHAVQQGDEIYYIQDVLDVDNLRGMWNFYGGFRDESGYEHDDVTTGNFHTMPNCVENDLVNTKNEIDWRHKGYYKLDIEAHSNSTNVESGLNGVQIEKKFKNNNTASNKVPVIDMSGDFDMIFEFKTIFDRDGQTLFDNYDHATSSGKGLKVIINSSSTNITVITDDGTDETIMVASSITTLNTVTFVRIRRQAGVFKLYLDGVEKTLTYSANTGNFNSTQDIHFFKEYDESTTPAAYVTDSGWAGIPIQFRFYNIALPDDEVKKLRVSKPVNTTMKFGGRIWKIEDKGSVKKLSCSSFARELLNTYISPKTFLGTDFASVGGGSRAYNRYYQTSSGTSTRVKMYAIIEDILKYVDSGVYSYFAKHPNNSCEGDFYADGTLLDIIKVLMMIDGDDHMFVVTPRKILFIGLEVSTDQVINNQNFNIVDSGKDDTVTTNSLFTTGRKKLYTDTKTFSTLASPQYDWTVAQVWTAPDGFTPVVERITKVMRGSDEIYGIPQVQAWENSGSGTFSADTYKLNDDNTIQFWNRTDGNAQTYVITYEYTYTYNRSSATSVAGATTQFAKDLGLPLASPVVPSTIDTNGLYHRNINVPQLANGFDIARFNTHYIADYKTINKRYRAISGSLINSLTVGQKVRFTEYNKQTDAYDTTELVVRSIEYSYPQTTTVIELGEYMFSGFDVEKQTVDSLRSLDSSVSISKY